MAQAPANPIASCQASACPTKPLSGRQALNEGQLRQGLQAGDRNVALNGAALLGVITSPA